MYHKYISSVTLTTPSRNTKNFRTKNNYRRNNYWNLSKMTSTLKGIQENYFGSRGDFLFVNKSDIILRNLRCRTCLNNSTETIPLENSISFEKFSARLTIAELIKECASVEIPLGDSRPQTICKPCVENASTSYIFRRKCQESEIILTKEFINCDNNIKLEDSLIGYAQTNHDRISSSDDDIPLSKVFPNYIRPTRTQKHICTICKKSFKSRQYLKIHINGHNIQEEIISKEESTKSRKNKEKYRKRKKNQIKTQNCHLCSKSFTKRTNLLAHLRRFHRRCKISDAELPYKDSEDEIDKYVENEPAELEGRSLKTEYEQTCDICFKRYKNRECLLVHRRMKHTDNLASLCPFCDWKGTRVELIKHKIADHGHLREIKCPLCDKMFFSDGNLKEHMKVHTGERNHMCDVCGRSFALKSNLTVHKRIHTGEKPYKCDTCGKTFAQHTTLRTHIVIHTEERNYTCSQCGQSFLRKGALRVHMKSHRSIDQWDKCNMCERRFKNRQLLRNHMLVHTGERKHTCPMCGKAFGRKSSMQVHLKIHTGERPHVCSVCSRAFLQKHVLQSHMKTHYNKFESDLLHKQIPAS